jgi:HSP20 family protein
MAEPTTKVSVKIEKTPASTVQPWRPFESLRQEIDRLFDDFEGGFWRSPFRGPFFDVAPFRRGEAAFGAVPAVDVTESDKAYEITAELPGMGEKNIEVKLAGGLLTIKGEKEEEKKEKKDYYVRERSFGSFERTFQVPDGVDAEKIEANFNKGVLTVTLPKSSDAQKAEKKIAVETGHGISSGSTSLDVWLTADAEGKPQLGAYISASDEANLTVYWHGHAAMAQLCHIVEDAEGVLAKEGGKVQGTLIAYGKRREQVGPTSGLSTYLAPSSTLRGFDAYRAELEGRAGKVVIWANVAAESLFELKDGGENIGLCVTPTLFNGAARPVIERAIQSTMSLGVQTISQLLNEVSRAMLAATKAA